MTVRYQLGRSTAEAPCFPPFGEAQGVSPVPLPFIMAAANGEVTRRRTSSRLCREGTKLFCPEE